MEAVFGVRDDLAVLREGFRLAAESMNEAMEGIAARTGTASTADAPADPSAGLGIGRIVHYVLGVGPNCGAHRPSLVVEIAGTADHRVSLQIFGNGPFDGIVQGGIFWSASVPYAAPRAAGDDDLANTWHWPERV